MGRIYLIVCKITGKQYVGQTVKKLALKGKPKSEAHKEAIREAKRKKKL